MTYVAYETMFWQCSITEYMQPRFKAILLIVTHKVGRICVSLRKEIISLILILIYLFMSRHEVHRMNIHTLQNAG